MSNGNDKLYELLPTSLAVLTGLMATVGGLTGGLARLVRNHPQAAFVTLVVGLIAILAALLALLAKNHTKTSRSLLAVACVAFVTSMALGIWFAVDTADDTDRPSIAVELNETSTKTWLLDGTVTASGMRTDGELQVYVYALAAAPETGSERRSLYAAGIGPNAEGVASQKFSIPVPTDAAVRTFVVTAAIAGIDDEDDYDARYCNGRPLEVGANLNPQTQPKDDGESACVTLSSPAFQASTN